MTRAPRVSIGLPVYNGERYLGITLDDWLGQAFGDFELVICDNASTDATADILAEAARRDDRVRVMRNERNLGALANANRTFDQSRGELFVLSAYDDRHAPTFLAELVSALDQTPTAGFAYGRSTLIDDDGQPLRFDAERRVYLDAQGTVFNYDAKLERPLPDDRVGRYRAVLRSNDVNAPIHGLFRRRVLQQVGPHRLHGSDRLIVAFAALLWPASFVEAPLFGYRMHAASTYHLTRGEWLRREAGRPDASSPLDGLRTLRAYLRAVSASPLTRAERRRAIYETLRYAIRPEVLKRLMTPNPDHYFGWTGSNHAPDQGNPQGAIEPNVDMGDWEWMTGDTSSRIGQATSG